MFYNSIEANYKAYLFYFTAHSTISKLFYNSEVDNIDNLNKEYNYIILDKSNKNILYIKNQHKNKNKKGSNSVLITNNELYDLIDKYKKQVEKFNTEKLRKKIFFCYLRPRRKSIIFIRKKQCTRHAK